MKVRPQRLSPSVVRGIAVVCVACWITNAHTAPAGINVWTGHGPNAGFVFGLAIVPTTPTTLYAGTNATLDNGTAIGGAFRSTDGGASWQAVNTGLPSGGIGALAIDPETASTLYAGSGGPSGGVFKTTDAGDTWIAVNMGFSGRHAESLAIDSSTPTTLYAGTDDSGVFKSTDAGANWRASSVGLPPSNVFALAIDPKTPSTLYAAGTGGVFKSTDGAGSWQTANTGLAGLSDFAASALAIDPNTPTTLYAGTTGAGVFKTTDGASKWQTVSAGLSNPSVQALGIDPTTPATLYVGTDGGGVFKSTDGAGSWRAINTGLPDKTVVLRLAIDPLRSSTVYAGAGDVVFSIQQVAVCTGDCDGMGSVTIDEIITLVNVALGNAQPLACPQGVPTGAEANVTLIIQAVSHALNGCSAPVCGDGVTEAGEECDHGGFCIGGTNADSACAKEASPASTSLGFRCQRRRASACVARSTRPAVARSSRPTAKRSRSTAPMFGGDVNIAVIYSRGDQRAERLWCRLIL